MSDRTEYWREYRRKKRADPAVRERENARYKTDEYREKARARWKLRYEDEAFREKERERQRKAYKDRSVKKKEDNQK